MFLARFLGMGCAVKGLGYGPARALTSVVLGCCWECVCMALPMVNTGWIWGYFMDSSWIQVEST